MAKGWICLHRKIWEHWVWKDPLLLKMWLDLVLLANHEPKKITIKGTLIWIGRGQFFTSYQKLADRWGVSRNTAITKLQLFLSDGMIYMDAKHGIGTLITIVNYCDYQSFSDNDCTNDCTNGCTNDCTNDNLKPAHNQQCITTINNEEQIEAASPWGGEFEV